MTQADRPERERVALWPGLDHIANFLNALDTEGMTAKEVRSAVYRECIKPLPIAALRSQGEREAWQDIATAPHNKSVLLGWADWRDGRWCMEVGAATTGSRNEVASSISQHGSATHWQPLPSPPRGDHLGGKGESNGAD